MKRRLLNLLTILSLLLCVGVVVLWERSYRRWDEAGWQSGSGRLYTVTSRLGALSFDVTDGWPLGEVWAGGPWGDRVLLDSDPLLISALPPPGEWSWLGFGLDRSTQGIGIASTGWTGRASSTALVVPHWMAALPLAAAPALRLVPFLRRRSRRSRGHCARCGYDLRATPGRCPECGTAAPVR